jgi:hypothetical protein
MNQLSRIATIALLLMALGPGASASAEELTTLFAPASTKGAAPWLASCLRKASGLGLRRGATLTVDCGGEGAGTKRARCAAQCDGRCMFTGDFDGDGQKRDVAIAHAAGKGDSSLWIVKASARAARGAIKSLPKGQEFEPTAHFPIRADDIAFVSSQSAGEAREIGQAVNGTKTNFRLAPGDRFAFGVLTWRRVDGGWDGDLTAVVWSKATGTYRLVPMLNLEAE